MTESVPLEATLEPDRGHLTAAQIRRLLKPVRADRIEQKQGKAYVAQHEVRAELMRIFGPGNADHTMHKPELLYETRIEKGEPQYPDTGNGKPYYVAAYLVGCTVRVRDYQGLPVYECTEYHVEENSVLPNRGEAHAMAVTSAQSYALRRAVISLGDAFGLHLYNKGSAAPLIGGTLQLDGDLESPDADPAAPTNAGMLARMADPATGEITDPPAEEEKPQAPARSRKAAAKVEAQDHDAETPAEPHPAAEVPNLNDSFKKPTRTRGAAPKEATA